MNERTILLASFVSAFVLVVGTFLAYAWVTDVPLGSKALREYFQVQDTVAEIAESDTSSVVSPTATPDTVVPVIPEEREPVVVNSDDSVAVPPSTPPLVAPSTLEIEEVDLTTGAASPERSSRSSEESASRLITTMLLSDSSVREASGDSSSQSKFEGLREIDQTLNSQTLENMSKEMLRQRFEAMENSWDDLDPGVSALMEASLSTVAYGLQPAVMPLVYTVDPAIEIQLTIKEKSIPYDLLYRDPDAKVTVSWDAPGASGCYLYEVLGFEYPMSFGVAGRLPSTHSIEVTPMKSPLVLSLAENFGFILVCDDAPFTSDLSERHINAKFSMSPITRPEQAAFSIYFNGEITQQSPALSQVEAFAQCGDFGLTVIDMAEGEYNCVWDGRTIYQTSFISLVQ